MAATEKELCAAMDAHSKYLYENFTKEERLEGIDSFGAWKAALEAAEKVREEK